MNKGEGSASALPAVPSNGTPVEADQWEADAVAAITAVSTPEEAEELLRCVKFAEQAFAVWKMGEDRERRWKALKLKAERRYGELLPKAETGRPQGNVSAGHVSNADRQAAKKARKVAAVPEPDFNNYVETAEKPTRDGLLREAGTTEKRLRQKAESAPRVEGLWRDEDVLAWVRKRMRAGKGAAQLFPESKAGLHGWPLPGKHLGQNAAEKAVAIIEDRDRRGDTNRRRQPKESGKRLRQLHAEKRAGHRDPDSDIWRMQVAIAEAVGVLECTELPDVEWSEDIDHILNELVYDLERHRAWSDRQFDAAWAHIDDVGRQRKLRELKKRADDPSSTQSERESAANLAEKLERKYREQKTMEGTP